MGQPDGAHTHGNGDGLSAALIVGAVVLALAVAGPVAAALAGLVELLLILVPVVVGLAVAAGAVLVVVHLRRPLRPPPQAVARVLPPAPRSLPTARPHGIEPPREVHVHFHGVTADDAAAILSRQRLEP